MQPIDFLYRASQIHGERTALEDRERRLTYKQTVHAVTALASVLQDHDPQPGSRVGLCAANSIEYLLGMLAIMAAGKVWVPLNYRSPASEIARIVDAVEPSILLVDDLGGKLVADGKEAVIGLEQFDMLIQKNAFRTPVHHERSRDDTQAIKFTGGTTGLPKGVMQPYRAWMAGIINQIQGWGITENDKFVVCAPLSHGTGTYLVPLLAQGGSVVLSTSNSPEDIAYAFSRQGGTITFMPPTLIYKIMADPAVAPGDFSKLRLLIYGGASMPMEKITSAQEFFGPVLATTYGQTEAPQIITMMRPEQLARPEKKQSVGRVTLLSEIAVRAPDGAVLPPNEQGEISVRGDLVMTGYWKLPEKTAEVLRDGWLHTGDVGFIDEAGFLHIRDRLRDLIITGGFNVYPGDVENVLSQHPAVHEASVFGAPDDKWGETVNAAIQLKNGHTVDESELRAFVRERLGPVLTPKRFHFYDSLPKSAVGKVLKTALRQSLIDNQQKEINQ